LTSGSIRVGHVDLFGIEETSLREHVSAVLQDFVRYQFPVRENVGFGNVHALDDDELIRNTLHKVNLLEAMAQLPLGIDTQLGREFEGGSELSGGQWQRIAIARAFMREAEILVLDEPTAALDPQAELEIFKQFMELSQGKTAFMISHRLGPARVADKILVMKQGQLIEQGTHEELMRAQGEYAQMFQAQAEWYLDVELEDITAKEALIMS
jgi:ATP-binding cassette, subfamily B, bacterial